MEPRFLGVLVKQSSRKLSVFISLVLQYNCELNYSDASCQILLSSKILKSPSTLDLIGELYSAPKVLRIEGTKKLFKPLMSSAITL